MWVLKFFLDSNSNKNQINFGTNFRVGNDLKFKISE